MTVERPISARAEIIVLVLDFRGAWTVQYFLRPLARAVSSYAVFADTEFIRIEAFNQPG
jgi:hypothetical protein